MAKLITMLKNHKLEFARIVLLGILLLAFNFGLPFWLLFIGILFSIYGLASEAFIGIVKERKIGTELYITVAVAVALLGGEYFAAGVVLMIILIAELIGDIIDERARSSIRSLIDLMPKTALLKMDAGEKIVPIDELNIDDVVIIRAGDKIPVDGVVIRGDGTVNQAAITGESLPEDKVIDSRVFAGTILQSGALDVRVTKLKADTLFSHIIALVEEAQDKQAPIQKLTDKVATYLIPISFLLVLGVYLYTRDVRMIIALLIFTSPAELGLATPLVMVAGIARAAREGILIKGGVFLEELSNVSTFVFDKTGTLTFGKASVEKVEAFNGYSEKDVLSFAGSANRRSNHPIAEAIVLYARSKNVSIADPTRFESIKGRGVIADIEGKQILLGNEQLLLDNGISSNFDKSSIKGTVSYLVIDGVLSGIISISDKIRDSAQDTITRLKESGIKHILMLTGDNESAAKHVADELKIEYRANLLPEDKINEIRRLQSEGVKVAMVGDGINDAPALAQANVGIAMGVMGNQAAMDAANVVLVGNDLRKIATVHSLSQRSYRTIQENIFVGVGLVHVAGITLVLLKIIGPVQAAIIHLVPDVLVFLNSIKLLKVKLD